MSRTVRSRTGEVRGNGVPDLLGCFLGREVPHTVDDVGCQVLHTGVTESDGVVIEIATFASATQIQRGGGDRVGGVAVVCGVSMEGAVKLESLCQCQGLV